MNAGLRLLSAAGVGAGVMYLFDPDRGKRRRALVRNKLTHASKLASDVIGKTERDVRNHMLGVFAEGGSLFRTRDTSDPVLEARVRSKLGRVVSHPSAIEVKAVNGLIILRGPVLAREEHSLLDSVTGIRGVRNIENRLELHEQAGNIPALQGGRPRRGECFGTLNNNWSPTNRLLGTAAGAALAVYGANRRGVFGAVIGSLGLGIVIRALTDLETNTLVGDRKGAVIERQKTNNIDVQVDPVDYWSHPESVSDVMSHVHELSCPTLTR